jgi:hypothetical protein
MRVRSYFTRRSIYLPLSGRSVSRRGLRPKLVHFPLTNHLSQILYNYMEGENRVRVFYGTEKREGERLEIYRRR